MYYGLGDGDGATPRCSPPDVSVILPGLLVGEYPRCEDIPWLRQRHGVTAVINLQDAEDLQVKGLVLSDLERAYTQNDVELYHFPVADYDVEQLGRRLPLIVERLVVLVGGKHRIYLHCN